MLLLLHICWCHANRLLLPGVKDGTRTWLGTDQQAIYAVQWPLFEIPFVLHFFQVHQLCVGCVDVGLFSSVADWCRLFATVNTVNCWQSRSQHTDKIVHCGLERTIGLNGHATSCCVLVFWCCVMCCGLFVYSPSHFTLTSITLIFHSLSLNVSRFCCSFFKLFSVFFCLLFCFFLFYKSAVNGTFPPTLPPPALQLPCKHSTRCWLARAVVEVNLQIHNFWPFIERPLLYC